MAQAGVWQNWGRCESARPARVETPAGDEAIAAVVKVGDDQFILLNLTGEDAAKLH